MKALVLWSSRTGNTKAVGEAIYEALPCEKEIFESGRQPNDLSCYDLIYVGFWGYRQGVTARAPTCHQEMSSLPSMERKSLSTARQAPIPTLLRQ